MSIGGSPVGRFRQPDFYGEVARGIVQPAREELSSLGRDFGVDDERIRGIITVLSEVMINADRAHVVITPQDVFKALSREFEPPIGSY
jgi:hypothetical protein